MFARLFGRALEHMIEAELTESLGYARHDPKGNNSGNSRNGNYKRKLRSTAGDTEIAVARDRNRAFEPAKLKKHERSTGEIENKITAMYARGMTVADMKAIYKEPTKEAAEVELLKLNETWGKQFPLAVRL